MDTDEAVKILAKSLYRELIRNGFTKKEKVLLNVNMASPSQPAGYIKDFLF
jgi:hypothetical protein